MTDYVVMFPADNEAEWEAGTEADHQATFDTDFEFAQLLKARGGAVTGGAGLAHSSKARTIKRGPKSNVLVTEAPSRRLSSRSPASSSSPATTTTRLWRPLKSSPGLTLSWRSDPSRSPDAPGATPDEVGTHPLIGTTDQRQMSALGKEVSTLIARRVRGQQVLVEAECCA